jgi:hypothetical protein
MTTQSPLIAYTDTGRAIVLWRAWGICTIDNIMMEVTLDPAKAAVWRDGRHKVVEMTCQELAPWLPDKAPGDTTLGDPDNQMNLL